MANPKVVVDILTDASKAGAGIDEASGKFGKFGAAMGRLTVPAAAALAGITALGADALNSASDLQQAAGGTEAVFGDSAKQIQEWGKQAADTVGLSNAAYQTFAAQIGAQLKNLGLPLDQVAGKTDDLIKLGADLAATYGGTTSEAVSALGAALRGEADPAERYGLALNQTAINAELAAKGQDKLTGSAATTAKAQAVLEMATKQAGGAIGQFGRESDTVSGQQQRLGAQMENLSATLGTALLPIITPIVTALADMAKWMQKNAAVVGPVIAAIAGLAAGILVLNAAMAAGRAIAGIFAAVQATVAAASYGSAAASYLVTGATIAQRVAQIAALAVMKAITAAQWLWNAAMSANPIGIIILAVVALVAAFVWLWNNVEGFRNFFIGIWKTFQIGIAAVVSWFRSAWASVAAFFQSVWQAVVFAVQLYFTTWRIIIEAVMLGIKVVVNAVVTWFRAAWAAVSAFFKSVWANATAAVQASFRGWRIIIDAVVRGFQIVVGAVAKWFASVWQSAVAAVSAIIKTLQRVFVSVFSAIQAPIKAVIGFFAEIVNSIKRVIDWLGRIKIPDVFGAIGKAVSGQATVAVSTAAVPVVSGTGLGAVSPRATVGVGSGGGTVININGGLDSADTIARRVRQLLESRDRREGGVRIVRAAH